MARHILNFVVILLGLLSSLAYTFPISGEHSPSEWRQGISKRGMDNLQATLSERSENGPVIAQNFPDPGLIFVNNQWYAFATRTKGSTVHIQVATSKDFDSWTVLTNSDGSQHDALPTLPSWVNNTGLMTWNTWAPYVQQIVSIVVHQCQAMLTLHREILALSCTFPQPLPLIRRAISTVSVLQLQAM